MKAKITLDKGVRCQAPSIIFVNGGIVLHASQRLTTLDEGVPVILMTT